MYIFRLKYKEEYEKFKLVLSVIGFVFSLLNLLVNVRYSFHCSSLLSIIHKKFCCRALELIFLFLLVWYYCTLTIRESILKVNGSRIKGWWRIHHFISTVAAGVLLIWPNSVTWYQFRDQFMWFNLYISKTSTAINFIYMPHVRTISIFVKNIFGSILDREVLDSVITHIV